MKKKIISFIIVVLLISILLPITTFAGDGTITTDGSYDISDFGNDSKITINSGLRVTLTNNNNATIQNMEIECGGEVILTLDQVKINNHYNDNRCALIFLGNNNHLILVNESKLESGDYEPGVRVESGASLEISGTGTLDVMGGENGAGIGGGEQSDCGSITIHDGYIIANGVMGGSGIGGGSNGSAGSINIDGGVIFAQKGGSALYDIGSGESGTGGELNISDDSVVFLKTGNCIEPVTTHILKTFDTIKNNHILGIYVTTDWNPPIIGYINEEYVFDLVYDKNGGEGVVPEMVSQYANTSVTIEEGNALVKNGCEFESWNTQSDGQGTEYLPNNEITLANNTLLYASYKSHAQFQHLFEQGEGTISSPFGISTPEQLNAVRNCLDAHYILLNNIDLTQATGKDGVFYNDGSGWEPIGNNEAPFRGSFNGKGYTISGLYIDRPLQDYVGLFGDINSSGTSVSSLDVDGYRVVGHDYVGVISGQSGAVISQCNIYGHISATVYVEDLVGNEYVGGITGYNQGSITACTNGGFVVGHKYAGGIAGYSAGAISDCSNFAGVAGITYMSGGIVGDTNAVISSCHNKGYVSGDRYVGGIAGRCYGGEIKTCSNTGTVRRNSQSSVGGIVGYLHNGYVSQCYNTGWLWGSSGSGNNEIYAGGIAGFIYSGGVSDCFNMGKANYYRFGGIVGSGGSVTRCYNAYNESGEDKFSFIKGYGDTVTDTYFLYEGSEALGESAKTLEELCQQTTFENFDFDDVWQIVEGERLPTLQGVPFDYTNGISLNKEQIVLGYNAATNITPIVSPDNASCKSIIWASSDESVVTIDDGNLTPTAGGEMCIYAMGEGSATITAKTLDGGSIATCEVTVKNAVTSIQFDKENMMVPVNMQGMLTPNIEPEDSEDQSITWNSSNTAVATVDNGVVTVHTVGTTIITVTATETGLSDTCVIRVVEQTDIIDFPDSNLKQALVDASIDKNQDGEITVEEIMSQTGVLDLSFKQISDLSGLEFAVGLSELDLSNNSIRNIEPLAALTQLDKLDLKVNILDYSNGTTTQKVKTALSIAGVSITKSEHDLDFISFHDQNLKNGLFSNGVDVTNDGQISISELKFFEKPLNLRGLNISNISDLEHLSMVKYLDLSDNNITDYSCLVDEIYYLEVLLLADNQISEYHRLGLNKVYYIDVSRNGMDISNGSENLTKIQYDIGSGIGVAYLEQSDGDEPEVIDFPDLNLKQALIEKGFDIDFDGELKKGEMKAYRCNWVDLYNGYNITSVEGLQYAIGIELLNLSSNNIEDISPLSTMPNLKNLSLRNNRITDLSPLKDLSTIESLDITGNQVVDVTMFANGMTGLKRLTMHTNNISDITALAVRTDLVGLHLMYNYIDTSISSEQKAVIDALIAAGVDVDYTPQFCDPIHFNDANLLQGLIDEGLDKNGDGEIVLGEIFYCDQLDLSNKGITDLAGLRNAEFLTWLDLSKNEIVNLVELDEMNILTYLDLSNNAINDISALDSLSRLEYLDLRNNSIIDIHPLDYDGYPLQLRELYLSGNRVSEIDVLDDLHLLETLGISENRIEDISVLTNCNNILTLDIAYNYLDIGDNSAQTDVITTLQSNGVSVIFEPQRAYVTGVQLSKQKLVLDVGDVVLLEAAISPIGYQHECDVNWMSNSSAVTVDDSGRITCVSSGDAIITVCANGYTDSCEVSVRLDEIISSKYPIDRLNGNYISIGVGVSVSDLKVSLINDEDDIIVYDASGNEYTGALVRTGMKVKLVIEGAVRDELDIIILGDASGDGYVSITDYTLARLDILGLKALDGAYSKACDINGDGVVSVTDYTLIRLDILGLKDIQR